MDDDATSVDVAVRDPHLAPVKNIVVTLADCTRLHSHHLALTVATLPYIGASVGICYADASDLRPVAEIG